MPQFRRGPRAAFMLDSMPSPPFPHKVIELNRGKASHSEGRVPLRERVVPVRAGGATAHGRTDQPTGARSGHTRSLVVPASSGGGSAPRTRWRRLRRTASLNRDPDTGFLAPRYPRRRYPTAPPQRFGASLGYSRSCSPANQAAMASLASPQPTAIAGESNSMTTCSLFTRGINRRDHRIGRGSSRPRGEPIEAKERIGLHQHDRHLLVNNLMP